MQVYQKERKNQKTYNKAKAKRMSVTSLGSAKWAQNRCNERKELCLYLFVFNMCA